MTRMSSEFREKLEAIAEFSKRYLEKTGRTLRVYYIGNSVTDTINAVGIHDARHVLSSRLPRALTRLSERRNSKP